MSYRRGLFVVIWRAVACGLVVALACSRSSSSGGARKRGPPPRKGSAASAARGRFLDLAVGRAHACALDAAGQMLCWGDNAAGQLGDGTKRSRAYLRRARLPERAEKIAVSHGRSCALLRSGRVACFGGSAHRLTAVTDGIDLHGDCVVRATGAVVCAHAAVTELGGVKRIAAAAGHQCALRRDGHVACVGDNINGQIGLPPRPRSHPQLRGRQVNPKVSGLARAVDVAVGERHSCAVLASGQVRCWGASFALAPLEQLRRVKAVEAAGYLTCVQLEDQTLRCFGRNHDGQLGVASSPDKIVAPPIGAVQRFGVAPNRVCVSRRGALYCWGELHWPHETPGEVALEEVRRLSARDVRSCAVTAQGKLYCWGRFSRAGGPRGDATVHFLAPEHMAADVLQVSAGSHAFNQVCAIRGKGRVACLDPSMKWVEPGVDDAVGVSVGSSHSCAVQRGGKVRCWGANTNGALGDGTSQQRSGTVTVVGLSDAVQVVAGGFFSCALRRTGRVVCWGNRRLGTLDLLAKGSRPRPGEVPGLTNVVAIAGGPYAVCARRHDGEVRCWGSVFGESKPTAIAAMRGAKGLSMGDSFVCGIRAQRPVCYQPHGSRLLGQGTAQQGQRPLGVPKVLAIAGGREHTCAITPARLVRCWGSNGDGQLGLGVGRHRPWKVPGSAP